MSDPRWMHTVPGAQLHTLSAVQPQWLTLSGCGVRINLKTGEVVIPEGLALTDAARAFWDAVQYIGGQRQ